AGRRTARCLFAGRADGAHCAAGSGDRAGPGAPREGGRSQEAGRLAVQAARAELMGPPAPADSNSRPARPISCLTRRPSVVLDVFMRPFAPWQPSDRILTAWI